MPRKEFESFTRLDASDVNTYLMDQSVMTFAGTAARGSAIPTPVEGMVTYLNDIDALSIYNGEEYVTNRPIQVFGGTAARGSAIGTAVEGMVAYLEDSNVLSINDGSVWKTSLATTGGILQVVSFTTSTTTTTTASSFQNTSLTASITPKSASNKILISFSCGLTGTTNETGSDLGLFRGNVSGTQLGSTSIAANFLSTSMTRVTPASGVFLDSPATASSVSYMVGLKSGGANSAVIRDQQTMILMEVAG